MQNKLGYKQRAAALKRRYLHMSYNMRAHSEQVADDYLDGTDRRILAELGPEKPLTRGR